MCARAYVLLCCAVVNSTHSHTPHWNMDRGGNIQLSYFIRTCSLRLFGALRLYGNIIWKKVWGDFSWILSTLSEVFFLVDKISHLIQIFLCVTCKNLIESKGINLEFHRQSDTSLYLNADSVGFGTFNSLLGIESVCKIAFWCSTKISCNFSHQNSQCDFSVTQILQVLKTEQKK